MKSLGGAFACRRLAATKGVHSCSACLSVAVGRPNAHHRRCTASAGHFGVQSAAVMRVGRSVGASAARGPCSQIIAIIDGWRTYDTLGKLDESAVNFLSLETLASVTAPPPLPPNPSQVIRNSSQAGSYLVSCWSVQQTARLPRPSKWPGHLLTWLIS